MKKKILFSIHTLVRLPLTKINNPNTPDTYRETSFFYPFILQQNMTAVVFEWNNGAVEKVQLAGSFTKWEPVGKLISTS